VRPGVTLPPPPPAAVRDPAAVADALLPGRGSVRLRTDDTLGNRLFVVPSSRLRVRRASTQLVGAAVCPKTCLVRISAAVALRGSTAPLRTRELTVRAGPAGAPLRLATNAALRRRIQRARGASATVAIRFSDATGAKHRATAKLRLLSPA
jgi:hypothetical protein